jgi:hypothetical protein
MELINLGILDCWGCEFSFGKRSRWEGALTVPRRHEREQEKERALRNARFEALS